MKNSIERNACYVAGMLAGLMAFAFLWLVIPVKATYDNDPAVMRSINHWVQSHDPAVNTVATKTQAALTNGGVHVANCVTVTVLDREC